MKIGMLLQRATDLKWAGPLAQEALAQKHRVTLLEFKQSPGRNQAKSYLEIRKEHCGLLLEQGADYATVQDDQIANSKVTRSLDAVVMQEGFHSQRGYLDDWQNLREEGVRLFSLAHFFEICQYPISALDAFDSTLYMSEYARQLHSKLQTRKEASPMGGPRSEQAVTGSPMFDQFKDVSRAESREWLGLNPDKKVVLLIAPVILPTTPWRFHVWRPQTRLSRLRDALKSGHLAYIPEIVFGSTFLDVYRALRGFCDRNQAKLVVKSRGKQKPSDFVAELADTFLDGFSDEYFPQFSTYKLIAAADLCVTVNSMAALEAVALRCPTINIYVPENDMDVEVGSQRRKYFRELLGGRPGTLMNYEGAVRKVDRRKAVSFFRGSWEDVSFHPTRREEFTTNFMGIEEQSASSMVLQQIESRPG